MKLPPCDPVDINGQPYTLAQMVDFVTTKDRRYNASAEDARQGKRTREAVAASGDLSAVDIKKLAEVIERPTCGWGEFVVIQRYPKPDGSFQELKQRGQAPTVLFLPLIDCIQSVAKSLG
jgi:hypothetical protein